MRRISRKEAKKLKENIQTINKIGKKKYGKELKKRWKKNIKGALLGGGVGLLIGVALKRNLVVYGIIGLIGGRILFNKNK